MFSYFYVNPNPFGSSRLSRQFISNRCASLQVNPILSIFARSILSSSQRCLFPAYSASKILCFYFGLWYSSCFDVKCWIHTFPKRCSHISTRILILLDHRGCHVNSFPTGVLLFKWIPSFSPSARSILSFLNGVCLIHPKLSLFFGTSHPFSSTI